MLKLFLVLIILVPGEPPVTARYAVYSEATCWKKAAEVLTKMQAIKGKVDGTQYGAGCGFIVSHDATN